MTNKTKELEALEEIKKFYASIYFNGEYIGDAKIVKIKKGDKLKLAYMPLLELKGDFYFKENKLKEMKK